MYWNFVYTFLPSFPVRLIETWDVLKCDIVAALMIPVSWLIETWDVLKLLSNHVVNSPEND